MKKPLLLSIALLACLVSYAQAEELDGITILPDAYTMKISADGTQVVGTPGDRSTIYYNLDTKDAYYYGNLDFGLGFVVADNGWIVGMDVEDSGKGVIMAGKTVIYPDVFDSYSMSDIHSITPDARRICGVVGNPGYGPTYLPFYCDIDESGNFGQVNILPYPDKDLFGMSPQFSSATWMSADGKTIAGQVVDARGFFIYPILYKENESGEWTISYPAESLFNPNGLPIPEPIPDLEEMFPGVTYPEITDFMSPEAAQEFEEALLEWEAGGFESENDPYENLDLFMTPEEIEAYEEAAIRYNNALEEYNILFDEYVEQLYRIVDDSVFFVRNAMTLSPDGKWLASSALVDDYSDPYEPVSYSIPYLMNLEDGTARKIGKDGDNLITNQVFADGKVLSATPAAGAIIPARSFIYLPDEDTTLPMEEFVARFNPEYGEWMIENLTGRIPVALDELGGYIFEDILVSGIMAASEDFSVICAGVDGYALDKDMYFSYILTDVEIAGVEKIEPALPSSDMYVVYNLQGVRVMMTKDSSALQSLPAGIYIINGKKIVLK